MIRTCLLVFICFGNLTAQRWSIEPKLGVRFDWNRIVVVKGDIQTEPTAALSYGVEVNRQLNLKTHQGIGFSRHGFGNAYIIEKTYSDPLSLGSMNYFYNTVSFHHTYQFLKIERWEGEAGVGGQLFFTKRLNGQSGKIEGSQISPLVPFLIEQRFAGKPGISPTGFLRVNVRYRHRPTWKFTTFFRGQLNVGTRALYTTNVFYEGVNSEGSGIIKNRGTGFMGAYGVRFEFGK